MGNGGGMVGNWGSQLYSFVLYIANFETIAFIGDGEDKEERERQKRKLGLGCEKVGKANDEAALPPLHGAAMVDVHVTLLDAFLFVTRMNDDCKFAFPCFSCFGNV
jgi:hypothetical protein